MPKQSARDRELDELHEQAARRRRRMIAESAQRLQAVLTNDAGFARLRAITDEEWEAAVQAGVSVEDNAA